MSKILFLVAFLFCSGTVIGLSVTYSPSSLGCGTTTVTGTFDCAFSGSVLLNISGGVVLDEPSAVITVVNGVMSFDLIVDGGDATTFNINGVVLASDDAACAPVNEQFSTSLTHTCILPANNDCSSAQPLSINYLTCSPSSYTTANQTSSGIVPSCGGAGYVDLWYEFVANSSGVTYELVSFPGTISYWGVYDACAGSEVACGFMTTFGSNLASITGLTANSTYKLQVLSLASAAGGTQTLCLYNNVTVAIEDVELSVTNRTHFNSLYFNSTKEVSNYEVQRKVNSQLEFQSIGEVKTEGAHEHEFSYDDHDIVELGTYTYRLKLIDDNGFVSYSNVVSTRNLNHKPLSLSVYPNPCKDLIHFDIGNYEVEGNFSIEILDASLKRVLIVHDYHTIEKQSFDVSDFSKGVYFARIRSEVENRVVKFVKI